MCQPLASGGRFSEGKCGGHLGSFRAGSGVGAFFLKVKMHGDELPHGLLTGKVASSEYWVPIIDKKWGQRPRSTGMKNSKLKWRKEVGLSECEQILEREGHCL